MVLNAFLMIHVRSLRRRGGRLGSVSSSFDTATRDSRLTHPRRTRRDRSAVFLTIGAWLRWCVRVGSGARGRRLVPTSLLSLSSLERSRRQPSGHGDLSIAASSMRGPVHQASTRSILGGRQAGRRGSREARAAGAQLSSPAASARTVKQHTFQGLSLREPNHARQRRQTPCWKPSAILGVLAARGQRCGSGGRMGAAAGPSPGVVWGWCYASSRRGHLDHSA